ncbi:phosphatidylglycerophosphatase A family protein, partial [Marinobacter adhaerens]|uniref:phosphatidylglycerophosphatase A family protein n=2 Tax=Pseudomonadota TaxID=1224 RepID=UPI003F71E261
MNKMIATFFGVGLLRPAPGTWGSLAALPVAYAVLSIGGFWLLVNLTFFVFMSGWIATREVTRGQTDHDPSYIVIDEVVGQWIALFPVGYGAMMMSVDLLAL